MVAVIGLLSVLLIAARRFASGMWTTSVAAGLIHRMDAMPLTMDRAPSEKLARNNMHRTKPNAIKKVRDETFRARQNARGHDEVE
ncbi:hypothetical protein C6503_26330 [Candidatus Poribacteria bacterium]|nr:MAG: hypothetical protein C6503_26330 [Candidatus Poribacteria bacterium]